MAVLSAGWLHGGLLHIIFNVLGIRQLGPVCAELYGPARTIIIYTVAGISGFVVSSLTGAYLGRIPILGGAEFTIGASASIFGLVGALVYYGRRGGSRWMRTDVSSYAITLFLFGALFPGIDNMAHLGGFGGGYLTARWLDPLRPERLDHLLAALACLAASALSIAASVIHALV